MARIPTPIPEAVADLLKRTYRQLTSGALKIGVWRLLVLATGVFILFVIAATGPGFIVAFIVGTILAALYTDDITATIRDIWNMNFWVWRVD